MNTCNIAIRSFSALPTLTRHRERCRSWCHLVLLAAAFCLGTTRITAQSTATNVTTGIISVPGERDIYTFNLAEDARFYFDSLSNAPSVQWSLNGPEGVVVANRSFSYSDAQSISDPTVALSPGAYTLTIESANGTTNAYGFRFVNVTDAALITPGTVVSNALAPANRTELFQFSGTAGDQLVFSRMARVSLPNTWWRLFDPYWNRIFNQGFSDVGTGEAPVVLPATGTYTLMLEGYIDDAGAGSYAFKLISYGNVPPTAFTGTAMNLGELLVGNLAANATNAYVFTLNSNTRVVFDSQTNSPNLYWTLMGPQGVVVGQRGVNSSDWANSYVPLSLPPGTYQFRLWGYTANPFSVRLLDLDTATPLTLSTPLTNSLSPGTATAMFRFNASAGQRYYFRNLLLESLPNAFWRLVDPEGVVLFSTYANGSAGPITANVSGVYTLLVEGYYGETSSGRFAFNVTPVVDGQQALTIGSLVNGAISSPGQVQRYTFSLPADARLYFDSLTNNGNLRWFLDGPTGQVVNNRGFNGSDAQNNGNPVLSLPGGNYTLTVVPNGDATAAYQFRLLDLNSAAPLVLGALTSGALNPANSTTLYRFTMGGAGEVFYDFQSSSGLPNGYITLLDSYGNIPMRTYLGNDYGPMALSAGAYTVLVEGYVGEVGAGNFSFNFVPVIDGQQALTLGQVVNGAISSPGQQQRYAFSLSTAGRLYFDSLSSNGSLRWSLDGPTGQLVNNRGFNGSDAQSIGGNPVLSLPSGNYTLTVFASGDTTSAYQFRFLDLNSATPLVLGSVTSGALNPANSTALYQFTMGAAGKVFYDYQSSSGLPNAFITLLDNYGNVPMRTYLGNDYGPMALPAGTYTLLVEGYVGEQGVGSFAFNLVPVVDGQQALTLGSAVSGAITSAGQQQQYTFSLPSPARLYFDSLTNNSSLRWSLNGPFGQVVNDRGFNNSDAQSIGNPVLPLKPGSYTLTVFASGDSIGAYRFRLFNLDTAAALTPGTPVTINNFIANSTDAYRFNANAGDRFYFPRLSSSGMPNGYWRLFDPYQNLVFGQYFDNVTTNTLAATGTYTLLVEGYVGDNGAASYGFNVVPAGNVPPPAFTGTPLSIGSLVTGTLDSASATAAYVFTLNSPASLYFDALTNANFTWSLRGPAGLAADRRSFLSSDGPDINDPVMTLPVGDYQLSVTGATGQYRFRLLSLADATAYNPGTTLTNTLSPADSTLFYKFTGAAGQRLYFDGGPFSGFSYQPYSRLYGPAGNLVFASYINGDVDTFTLPQSGNYTLSVEGRIYDTHDSGTYVFNLLPVTYLTNALTIGQTVSNRLATPGQRHYLTFTVPAPTTLYFDALSNVNFMWRLDGVQGQVSNWRQFTGSDSADISDPALLLPAGTYTLTVAANDYAATGDYQFRFLRFDDAAVFTPGTMVTQTLTPANSTALYRFTGTAGQRYYFDGQPAAGFTYQPYCRLYGPLGNILFNVNVNGRVDTFTLPQSGTYTLTVEGRVYDTHESAEYAFNLLPVTHGTNTLVFGQTIKGTLSTPGQRQFYAFNLTTPKTVYLDILTNVDFYWRLDGPWEQPVQRSFRNSDSADINDPFLFLPAGSYSLTVFGANFHETGDYSFRVLDIANATAFTPSTVVSNSLSPTTSTVLYRFTGTSGDRFYFDGGPTTGFTYQPYCRLYGPSGQTLFAANATSDVDTFTLAQSGTYTLSVEGRIYDANPSGTFSFNLVPNPVQPPQPLFPEGVLPDLTVSSVTVQPPTGVRSGEPVTVHWTDQNSGSGPTSGSFADRVTIRNASQKVLVDSLLPYNEADPGNGPLAPGSIRTRQLTVRLPDGADSVGTLGVTVTVDAQNNLAEANEANNAGSTTFPVTISPYPDLLVQKVTATPSSGWQPGAVITISWQLTNSGSAFANTNWADSIVVRNTNTASIIFSSLTNYVLSAPGNGPLGPAEVRNRAVSFTLPNNVNAFGVFEIAVTTDSGNQVFEYNPDGTAENNNSTVLRISSAPDLLPSDLAVSASGPIHSGSRLNITWKDQNAGNADCAVGFYEQVTITHSDTSEVLATTSVYYNPNAQGNGPIAPGDSRSRSASLDLPDGARSVGTLQISVAVDSAGQVPEFNAAGTGEANNTLSITAVSTIADYPNLQAVNLGVQPAVLYSGSDLTLRWQDTNNGTAPVPRSWYDRVTLVNTNLGITLLDRTVYYDVNALGMLTNGTARDRVISLTLPSGSNGSGGLLFTVTADCFNNVFEYSAAGAAENDNAGSLAVYASLAPLPDLVITSVSVTNRAFTSQLISAQAQMANKGLVNSEAATAQRVFLSSTPTTHGGTLAGQSLYDGTLAVGQSVGQNFSLLMPSIPGTYWLVAQADANNTVSELSEDNNFLVSTNSIEVLPAYAASVKADVHAALANTDIPMHGQATIGDGSQPAGFVPVTIHVRVRGTDRTYTVLTGADGTFTNLFRPLPGEAGVYEISAALPAQAAPPAQDTFVLIGMAVAPVGLVGLTEGESITNVTRVENLSDVELTDLQVTIVTNPPNVVLTVQLDTNALAGFANTSLRFTAHALDGSIYQGPVVLHLSSAEGAVADLTFIMRIEALRPRLTLGSGGTLRGVMVRGVQTPVSFPVANQGGRATGPLQVVLPNEPWLALASAAQIPPLQPGSNTTVTLLLTPAANLPLGEYTGALVLQSTNAAMQVPYSFRAISESKGNLLVTAEDEYTYFAAGSPRVTNAEVLLRDALTGSPVVTNFTGADGTLLLTNLTEAFYIVDVRAEGHSPFRQTALVPAGASTNVVAFLQRQTVTYDFTVTPTTVADRYVFSIQSTFETQVPVPVVTLEPASLDLAQYPGPEVQVLYTVANHGLIDADHVSLEFPSTDYLQITALVTNLGKLPANTSFTVPVLIKRLNPSTNTAVATASATRGPRDYQTGQCSVTPRMLWDYLCGPNVVNKQTATYVFDSTGCDLVDLYFKVYDLVPNNPPAPGSSGPPPMTTQDYVDYLNQLKPVLGFTAPAGYHFECKTTPPASSPVHQLLGSRSPTSNSTSVCAKVEIRLDQSGVVARDAFKATLKINNDLASSLQNVRVDLQITELSSKVVTTNFGISLPSLSGLTAVDGTGILPGNTVGQANWTLIPTLEAAPTNGVTVYLVGGSLSYMQDGTQVSVPLAAAPIQVFPQPELLVRYFHDRDVYADDPFTPAIEPSIPYSLAVQVNNVGYGAAQSLNITSGKPQIVDNIKGLLINFTILGTQLENREVAPTLSADFGRIEPGTNAVARWLFSSPLQGSFTNFSASFSQVDQLGNARLSLIRSVEIHELTRIVNVDGAAADSRPDFLVNDVADADFVPDTLYLSDGSVVPVAHMAAATLTGTLSDTNLSIAITSAPSAGWGYLRVGDPNPGQYRLAHVFRADNSEVTVGTNVWTTDRSFVGGDKVPIHTNLIHLVDYNSGGTYRFVYAPIITNALDTVAPVSAVAALPANSAPEFTVQWTGSDNAGGLGIATYDIFVSINNGPFSPWLTNTTLFAARYTGVANNTYRFFSRAIDRAGNREAAHLTADAQTSATLTGNSAPVIAPIPAQSVTEGALFSFTPSASDSDVPAQTLTWSLLPGAPAGALVVPSTGKIAWQTGLGTGGTTSTFRLVATDNGFPSLSATQTFNVVVSQVNHPPEIIMPSTLLTASDRTLLSVQLTATDPDTPQQTLTWELGPGAPAGLAVNASTGLLTWTPTAAQAPSTNQVTVLVKDNGSPVLSDSITLVIVVGKLNQAPVLTAIPDQVARVLQPLTVALSATDGDLPAQRLAYSLDAGAPTGARVNPTTGVFSWVPSRTQAPSTNLITVRVSDDALPPLSDTKTFKVVVPGYVEVMLGESLVEVGEDGEVSIDMTAATPVTNLSFILDVPPQVLTNFNLAPPLAPVATAALQPLSPTRYRASFQATAGQSFSGPQSISKLSFHATAATPSKFLPLIVSGVTANQPNGPQVEDTLQQDGRVVLINRVPLLESFLNGSQLLLVLYAPSGSGYSLEATPGLSAPIVWSPIWNGEIGSSLFQVIPVGMTNNSGFFRGKAP